MTRRRGTAPTEREIDLADCEAPGHRVTRGVDDLEPNVRRARGQGGQERHQHHELRVVVGREHEGASVARWVEGGRRDGALEEREPATHVLSDRIFDSLTKRSVR